MKNFNPVSVLPFLCGIYICNWLCDLMYQENVCSKSFSASVVSGTCSSVATCDIASPTFDHVMSDKYRCYSCAQCHFFLKIEPDQYVEKVMNDTMVDLLPVQEWQIKRATVLAALSNQYKQSQV